MRQSNSTSTKGKDIPTSFPVGLNLGPGMLWVSVSRDDPTDTHKFERSPGQNSIISFSSTRLPAVSEFSRELKFLRLSSRNRVNQRVGPLPLHIWTLKARRVVLRSITLSMLPGEMELCRRSILKIGSLTQTWRTLPYGGIGRTLADISLVPKGMMRYGSKL